MTQSSTLAFNPLLADEQLTLGKFAFESLQKHFHKSVMHKAEVLDDQDPEPLHQMRVGMRRLRTALKVFTPFIALSSDLHQDITQIAKTLGTLRDLDVLGIGLQNFFTATVLETKESKHMRAILSCLGDRRRRSYRQIAKILEEKQYKKFCDQFQGWLETPKFEIGASWPIDLVLPDLLMPLMNEFLLHSGWLIEINPNPSQNDPDEIPLTPAQEATLHDLRKQTKRIRYQTEFFKDFYGAEFAHQIEDFKAIQDCLGTLHDTFVFSQFLESELGKNWQKKVPSLKNYLRQQRGEHLQQWQQIRQKHLILADRAALRNLICQPSCMTTGC